MLVTARRAPVTVGLSLVLGIGLAASMLLTAGSLTIESLQLAGSGLRAPARFMWYYRDRFNARYGSFTGLSVLWFHLCWDLLGQEPTHQVLIGRDGWMFLRSEGEVDDVRGLSAWTEEQRQAWLDRLQEWCKVTIDRGIPLVIAVAPNKSSMLPEMLPFEEPPIGTGTRYLELIRTKEQWSPPLRTAMLDLHERLLEADPTRCYYRTDTHWNHEGAEVAAEAIADRLKQWDLVASPSTEVPMVDVSVHGGDLARMMGASTLHVETVSVPSRVAAIESIEELQRSDVAPRPHGGDPRPRVLLLHDSFGMNLLDPMAARFPGLIARRGFPASMTGRNLSEILDAEQVDAVVILFVERRLLGVP